MKTTGNTEEVSSHLKKNGHWSQKWRRNTPCAAENAPVDLEKRLANLWSRQTIKKIPKKAHAGHGPETKWEMSDKTMRRIFLILVPALLPVVIMASESDVKTPDGLVYNFLDDLNVPPWEGAEIEGYVGGSGRVGVPDNVDGLPVDSINVQAFQNMTILLSIRLSTNILNVNFARPSDSSDIFYGCTSLKNVAMPPHITSIGDGFFDHCHSLLTITIGNDATNIGNYAFFDCPSLTNIVIGNSVKSIGYQAFQGCTSLKQVAVPDSVTSIESDAFHGCINLTNVTLGSGLTDIGDTTFYGCTGLRNITMSDNVTYVGVGAFYGCTGLTNVTLGNNAITEIWDTAFFDCYSLTGIKIPDGVTIIGSAAFYDCSSLTRVTIPTNVTLIFDQAFYYCTRLTNIIFQGNAPRLVGVHVFDGLPTNAIVYYYYGMSGWGTNYGGVPTRALGLPFSWRTNNFTNFNVTITGYTGGFTNLILPDNINGYPVTGIGNQAFINANLVDVTIPNSVTYIEDGAFSDCTNLINLTFLGNAPNFGADVFAGVPANTTIYYLNGASGWNNYYDGLFAGPLTTSPDGFGFSLNEDNTVTITGYSGSGGNIVVPDMIYGVPVSTFDNCSEDPYVTSVTISGGVTGIGSYAFNNCNNLTNVTIGSCITNIGDYAFSGCGSLTNITFLGDAPALGADVFAGAGFDATAYYLPGASGWDTNFGGLPAGMVTAATLDGFEYATYRDHVKIVGYNGSGGAVTVPDTINNYPVSAIDGIIDDPADGPWVMTIPNSITNIADNSFTNCNNLTNITFLGNAPTLGTNVFNGIAPGATVYYYSGTTGWGATYGGLPASELDGAFIYQANPDGSLTVTSLIANDLGPALNIPPFVYSQPAQSVTGIGDGAFSGLTNLIYVLVPGNVTNIGDEAFSGCVNLTNITFLGDAPAVGTGVFMNVGSGATVYYLPGTSGWDTTLGGLAAEMITTTSDGFGFAINDDETVTITNYTGAGGAITIPDAIYGHPVSIIDDPNDGVGVTCVTVPASIVSIGDNSFNNFGNLTNITFLGNAPALGTNVFNGIAPGAAVYYYYGTSGWGMTIGGLPAIALNVPASPTLSAPAFINNQFQFTVNGASGSNYVVQAATSLVTANWISLDTNTAPFQFTETNANSFSQRFYRAKIWP